MAAHRDPARWPALRAALTAAFAGATRDEWAQRFAGRDACVTPVLELGEAPTAPHAAARDLYAPVAGHPDAAQVTPTPRFTTDPGAEPAAPPLPGPAPQPGEHTAAILAELGVSDDECVALHAAGVVGSGRAGAGPWRAST